MHTRIANPTEAAEMSTRGLTAMERDGVRIVPPGNPNRETLSRATVTAESLGVPPERRAAFDAELRAAQGRLDLEEFNRAIEADAKLTPEQRIDAEVKRLLDDAAARTGEPRPRAHAPAPAPVPTGATSAPRDDDADLAEFNARHGFTRAATPTGKTTEQLARELLDASEAEAFFRNV